MAVHLRASALWTSPATASQWSHAAQSHLQAPPKRHSSARLPLLHACAICLRTRGRQAHCTGSHSKGRACIFSQLPSQKQTLAAEQQQLSGHAGVLQQPRGKCCREVRHGEGAARLSREGRQDCVHGRVRCSLAGSSHARHQVARNIDAALYVSCAAQATCQARSTFQSRSTLCCRNSLHGNSESGAARLSPCPC